MRSNNITGLFFRLIAGIVFLSGCTTNITDNVQKIDRRPVIEPDYTEVTIPPNIAPMNFSIKEEGSSYKVIATSGTSGYQVKVTSRNGVIRLPLKSWRKLTRDCAGDKIKIQVYSFTGDKKTIQEYDPFYIYVANEPVDPYLTYRLIHPGYYNWSKIKIVQRSLESFSEESIIENQILEMNCVNCHSFSNYNPERFLVHIRGSEGGTYFVENGKITRKDLKIAAMPGGATYPSWHPGGRYVAFSSNQVRQNFYAHPSKSIEVFDLVSSLILFDTKNNDIVLVKDHDTTRYLQTFPSWSPDGRNLYFCRARQGEAETTRELEEIETTKYDIARISFNPESGSFGEAEIVFNASERNKSASFPRISPDGKYLIFTLDDYGTFPIWHREADLYSMNLISGESRKMDINSDETESYHAWSSNGRWLVFSSKRIDGRSARPFFAYFDSRGNTGKPFVLPQRDPALYKSLLESFNIPEFVNGKIRVTPRDFAAAAKRESVRAVPGNPLDSLPGWEIKKINVKRNPGEKPIHE